MAEFPALPLWTDSYIADCAHLSFVEHGAYLSLLLLMWRSPECRVPNDDEWIMRKLRCDADAMRTHVRSVMREFCETDGNWVTQKRLRKEWGWCRDKRQKNTEAAKSRWEKENAPSERSANGHANGMPPSLTLPTPSKVKSSKKDISGFDEFYSAFPKHVGKGAAVKAYASALGRATAEAILAGAKRLAEYKAGTDKQFIQNPATWLNADGWLDEIYPTTGGTNGRKSNHETFYDAASAVAARIASRGHGQAGGPEQATILLLPTRPDKAPD